ncbi:MAG TPA: hypothetical protein H9934_07160 [Candidatus Anaerobutyricum faecale]|nr:hypothetical protein [Candidatus Anaerobutyricum faecale]
MKLKRFFEAVAMATILALAGWLAVSWVNVLMHNDPIYGDKQYMPGNAIVMITELAK